MTTTIMTVLYPVLLTILAGVLGYVGKEVVKLVPIVSDYIIAHIGLVNYTKYKAVALDIFRVIEEEGRLGKLANNKISVFESMMKDKFPAITDEEINTFRQAIAGEFNKDKPVVVKELEVVKAAQTVATVATVKYVDLKGNILVKEVVTAVV